jgi:hypothetical protein
MLDIEKLYQKVEVLALKIGALQRNSPAPVNMGRASRSTVLIPVAPS